MSDTAAPPLLATRDAIVAALKAAGLGITGDWDRSGEELVADALLASGVVRDPATLADDEAVMLDVAERVWSEHEPNAAEVALVGVVTHALAAALTEDLS